MLFMAVLPNQWVAELFQVGREANFNYYSFLFNREVVVF